MLLFDVSWLGVIISTVASYIFGALWFSPALFGNVWMKELKFTKETMESKKMIFPMFVQFVGVFLLTLVIFKSIDFGGYPLLILMVIAFATMEKANALFQGNSIKLITILMFYRLFIIVIATIVQLFF